MRVETEPRLESAHRETTIADLSCVPVVHNFSCWLVALLFSSRKLASGSSLSSLSSVSLQQGVWGIGLPGGRQVLKVLAARQQGREGFGGDIRGSFL